MRSLGVYLDSSLTIDKQVNAVSRACYYQIRNIGCIRQFITTDACKTLVNSLVTSRLDYGNALLYRIPKLSTPHLQGVQNSAAHLITRTWKREHITSVLKSLHWLPVVYRPLYKLLMYTYKVLNSTTPVYLEELVIPYHPRRSLISESGCLLCVPKTSTATYRNRWFSKSAASLWNNLPMITRQSKSLNLLKKNVKTHFFDIAYS